MCEVPLSAYSWEQITILWALQSSNILQQPQMNTHERTGLSTGTGSTLLEAHQALAAEVQDSGVRWGESYRVAGGGREDLCEHGGS